LTISFFQNIIGSLIVKGFFISFNFWDSIVYKIVTIIATFKLS